MPGGGAFMQQIFCGKTTTFFTILQSLNWNGDGTHARKLKTQTRNFTKILFRSVVVMEVVAMVVTITSVAYTSY